MAKKTSARSAKSKTTSRKTAKKIPAKKAASRVVKKSPVKKSSAKPAPAKKKAGKKTVRQTGAKTKKTSVKKPTASPAVKKATKQKAPAKKKAAGNKPAVKSTAKNKSVKTTPPKKTPAKKQAAAKSPSAKKKTAVETTPQKAAPPAAAVPAKKAVTKAALKSRLLGKTKSGKSGTIGFSLDEVKEIAKNTAASEKEVAKTRAADAKAKAAAIEASLKTAKPTKVAAASLADILGFNPAGGKKATYEDPKLVPAKFRKYYRLLLDLRTHLTGQIDQHAEDTLKRSSKDDAGDLSSYGQHMADAGTDTFDRDFALSLVANEQEALSEIEAAIKRIKNGTFGVDEITGEPIDKDRLSAVPFTRYSAKTQKDLERNRHRVRTQAGLGVEMGDSAGSYTDPNGDD